jgi:hypothetical protein
MAEDGEEARSVLSRTVSYCVTVRLGESLKGEHTAASQVARGANEIFPAPITNALAAGDQESRPPRRPHHIAWHWEFTLIGALDNLGTALNVA